MEHRFYPVGETPIVSTREWHAPRERARHREEPGHSARMQRALEYVVDVAGRGATSLVDLGAGDGGFLSMVKERLPDLHAWGYDFSPANLVGAKERGVSVYDADFTAEPVTLAQIMVMTEVLEHLDDPHGQLVMAHIPEAFLVCSSPNGETPEHHDGSHAWGWDMEGYAAMITAAGWDIIAHSIAGSFQVVAAVGR